MNIVNDKPIMIFSREFDGRTYYQCGLSKKLQDGTFENGYMNVQFKKDVSLFNKTTIKIKKAWISFYLKGKVTVPYIFINEFDIVDEPQQFNDDFTTVYEDGDLPF